MIPIGRSITCAGRRAARRLALLLVMLALAGCDGAELAGLEDLDGEPVDPLSRPGTVATVALFVDSDCPVSNRYAPEVQRLHGRFAPRGVQFWLVYPDPDISAATIREHLREYGYTLPALRDPRHSLVALARAQVTPEAAVFTADRGLAYHGRIDDRYVDIGRQREPTRHDLEVVLEALLAGREPASEFEPAPGRALAFASSPGIGCFIRDLK